MDSRATASHLNNKERAPPGGSLVRTVVGGHPSPAAVTAASLHPESTPSDLRPPSAMDAMILRDIAHILDNAGIDIRKIVSQATRKLGNENNLLTEKLTQATREIAFLKAKLSQKPSASEGAAWAIESLELDLREKTRNLEIAKNKLGRLEEEGRKLELEKSAFRKKLENSEDDVQELQIEVMELKKKNGDLENNGGAKLRDEINRLKDVLKQKHKELTENEKAVKSKDEMIVSLNSQVDYLKDVRTDNEDSIRSLESRIENLKKELGQQSTDSPTFGLISTKKDLVSMKRALEKSKEQVAFFRDLLEQKDTFIQEKCREVVDAYEDADELKQVLRVKDQAIEHKDNLLAQRARSLEGLAKELDDAKAALKDVESLLEKEKEDAYKKLSNLTDIMSEVSKENRAHKNTISEMEESHYDLDSQFEVMKSKYHAVLQKYEASRAEVVALQKLKDPLPHISSDNLSPDNTNEGTVPLDGIKIETTIMTVVHDAEVPLASLQAEGQNVTTGVENSDGGSSDASNVNDSFTCVSNGVDEGDKNDEGERVGDGAEGRDDESDSGVRLN